MAQVRVRQEGFRRRLARLNVNVSDFADTLGTPRAYLFELVNGRRSPGPRMRQRLMSALDVTDWDELFEFAPTGTEEPVGEPVGVA